MKATPAYICNFAWARKMEGHQTAVSKTTLSPVNPTHILVVDDNELIHDSEGFSVR